MAIEWVITSLASLVSVFAGVSAKVIWDKLKVMEGQVKKALEETGALKSNYLERFAAIQKAIGDSEKNVTAAINALGLDLAKNYVQKGECIRLVDQHEQMARVAGTRKGR